MQYYNHLYYTKVIILTKLHEILLSGFRGVALSNWSIIISLGSKGAWLPGKKLNLHTYILCTLWLQNFTKFCASVSVCLFGVFCPTRDFFHSYGDVTIAGEGLQILTYARHSWPLSSEVSLMCHTYYDTGLRFIMVISEDPWHSHLLPSVWQWNCHYLFLRLRYFATGDRNDLSNARWTLYATAAIIGFRRVALKQKNQST